MGALLCELTRLTDGFELATAHDRDDLEALPPGAFDVAIDFTLAEAIPHLAEILARMGRPWVSGTTGLAAHAEAALDEAAQRIPVLWAPNMSLGITLLRHFVERAARMLPASWEMELIERHHSAKRDAPSGTALALAERWIAARGGALRSGRSGVTSTTPARPSGDVGIHAVRLPRIVGEHQVVLGSDEEQIELIHRAHDRSAFARGALEAARWIHGKPAGRYSLDDWARERLAEASASEASSSDPAQGEPRG